MIIHRCVISALYKWQMLLCQIYPWVFCVGVAPACIQPTIFISYTFYISKRNGHSTCSGELTLCDELRTGCSWRRWSQCPAGNEKSWILSRWMTCWAITHDNSMKSQLGKHLAKRDWCVTGDTTMQVLDISTNTPEEVLHIVPDNTHVYAQADCWILVTITNS